ncbi:UNVERIFIED_CONTAM: hypothetical protein Slati_0963300 [Sesamum latifolium]|uniref:Zinc knuckle CX2CX4HX4C domain-containing protein n=1 Tax=Sesamum latifolium TaxID=2727402 RepID=A0AAW2XU20_9LAMI
MDSDLGRLGSSLFLTEEEESGWVVPTGLWHAEPPSLLFKEVDLDKNGEVCGSFVCTRVALDITKLLKRALKIRTVLGDEQLVSFTYERLPNFCYFFGCLGYLSRQCDLQFRDGFSDPGENPPYGIGYGLLPPSLFGAGAAVSLPEQCPVFLFCQSSYPAAPFNPSPLPVPRAVVHLSLETLLNSVIPRLEASPTEGLPNLPPFINSPSLDLPSLTLCQLDHPSFTATIHPPSQNATSPSSLPCSCSTTKSPMTQPKKLLSKKRYLMDELSGDEVESQGSSKLCKGLGGPWTVQHLGHLIRDNNPSLIFLAETKCLARRIDLLKRQFDMNGVCVPSSGKSGGLAVIWIKSVNVLLQNFSHNHIDVSVQLEEEQSWWRFTGIYGELDTSKRELTWKLLARLHTQSNRAWLCAGDFNEIFAQSEKLGDPPHLADQEL